MKKKHKIKQWFASSFLLCWQIECLCFCVLLCADVAVTVLLCALFFVGIFPFAVILQRLKVLQTVSFVWICSFFPLSLSFLLSLSLIRTHTHTHLPFSQMMRWMHEIAITNAIATMKRFSCIITQWTLHLATTPMATILIVFGCDVEIFWCTKTLIIGMISHYIRNRWKLEIFIICLAFAITRNSYDTQSVFRLCLFCL